MESLIFFAILLGIGYFFGTRIEKQHYQSLRHREQQTQSLFISPLGAKTPTPRAQEATLMVGSVVIAADFFKTFVAGILKLLGGRIEVYESLLDRARREAVLRMQEAAIAWGAKQVVNVRIETAELGGNNGNGIVAVEVIAYGTALK
jgi:uncharacterized protein YbjQ (UPF0145 family)